MDYNNQTVNNLLSAKLRKKITQSPKMNLHLNTLKYSPGNLFSRLIENNFFKI